jgi:hypothetical protein
MTNKIDKLYTRDELIALLEENKIVNRNEFNELYSKNCPNIQIGKRKLYQFSEVIKYIRNVKSERINEIVNNIRHRITVNSKELNKYLRVRKKLGKNRKYIL